MKQLMLFFFCCTVYANLQAQFLIDYNISYAGYNMGDMKDFLHSIEMSETLKQLGIKNVDNFPAFVAHNVNLGYRINKHEFGIKSSFYSTGGKLSVADYSGSIAVKITTNGFREGIYYKNHFYTFSHQEKEKFSLWVEISPAIIISVLKMKTIVHDVSTEHTLEDFNFNEMAFAVLPQFGGRYCLTKHINFNVSAGYELSFGGKFEDLSATPRADWSGFRLNGGIGLIF